MVTKNTHPEQVELDWGSFKEGSVDVLVHWNIVESTIPQKKGVSNSTKLVLKAGNKIRITADSTDVYAMICPVSGL